MPALLAEAEYLAATLMLGEHGRRRAGQGDEFWQYRPAQNGDAARSIDWIIGGLLASLTPRVVPRRSRSSRPLTA